MSTSSCPFCNSTCRRRCRTRSNSFVELSSEPVLSGRELLRSIPLGCSRIPLDWVWFSHPFVALLGSSMPSGLEVLRSLALWSVIIPSDWASSSPFVDLTGASVLSWSLELLRSLALWSFMTPSVDFSPLTSATVCWLSLNIPFTFGFCSVLYTARPTKEAVFFAFLGDWEESLVSPVTKIFLPQFNHW